MLDITFHNSESGTTYTVRILDGNLMRIKDSLSSIQKKLETKREDFFNQQALVAPDIVISAKRLTGDDVASEEFSEAVFTPIKRGSLL